MSNKHVISVIGARPQFIKAATVSRALANQGIKESVVHTGQHYDEKMSGQFLEQLGINNVVCDLAVGSGNQAHQTARIMSSFSDFLDREQSLPNAILVYGDTNSTIGAGLVASKLNIPLIHVEAGLRSYNREMPEEINRVVVDHLSQLLFCSSPVGVDNLKKEGITEHVYNVGDVMLDAFLYYTDRMKQQNGSLPLIADTTTEPFVLVTIHRPSNTDSPNKLQAILNNLGGIGKQCIWPVHPRNKKILESLNVPDSVSTIPPVGYLDMLGLLNSASAVITDSGGLQKEAYWAKSPCVTIRNETEWTETLMGEWNVLCDPVNEDFSVLLQREQTEPWRLVYGDGQAANRIAENIKAYLESVT